MKKTICVLGLLLLISCSDKLSESKATKLFVECDLNGNSSGYNTLIIPNKITESGGFSDYKNFRKFQILAKDLVRYDYIRIDTLREKNSFGTIIYNISVNDKLKPFLLKDKVKPNSKIVKIVKLIPENIINIQEYPAFNTAEVTLEVKGEWLLQEMKEIPIFKNNTATKNITISYTKTNKGWNLCE